MQLRTSDTANSNVRCLLFVTVILSAFPTCFPASSHGRIRHPEDQLVWFQAENPVLLAHQPKTWNVGMGGLVVGARYVLQLEITNGVQLLYRSSHEVKADGSKDTLTFALALPPMMGGQYNLDLVLKDTFPGLEEDDAFLAARSLHVQIAEPKRRVDVTKRDVVCKENQVWPPSETVTSRPDTISEISLVTVASIDRSLAVLHLVSRWAGAISVAMYARNDEEEEAIRTFVNADLGPFCKARGHDLRLMLLSSCTPTTSRGPADVYSFPINKLRSEAVKLAVTDLVLYVDVDFLPSDGALAALRSFPGLEAVRNGSSVLVLPCFMTEKHSQWPAAATVERGASGELTVEVGAISKEQLRRERAGARTVTIPGEPSSLHSHGAVDYIRWLREGAESAYEVPYTFFFEPYFVVSKRRWGGLYRGMFDERFLLWGGDKAQLAYEAATLGYRFLVHPSAFLVHAPARPEFRCHWALGALCEVAARTKAEWQERQTSQYWDYDVIDFIVSLPLWTGHPPEGEQPLCFVPPYAFLADLPRLRAAAIALDSLLLLARKFTDGMNPLLRGPPGADAARGLWRREMQRWCFGQAPLVGRISMRGGRGRVLVHRDVLGGWPVGEGEEVEHFMQAGEGGERWEQVEIEEEGGRTREKGKEGGEGEMGEAAQIGSGMVVLRLPKRSVCEASVQRELPGWVRCRVVTNIRGANGTEAQLADRQAWVMRDEEEEGWRVARGGGGQQPQPGAKVDQRLMDAKLEEGDRAFVEAIRNKEYLSWTRLLKKSSDLQDFRDRMRAAERTHSLLPAAFSADVFLSDARNAQNISRLRELGVTHVLNVAGQYADELTPAETYAAHGITLRAIPSNDDEGYPMLAMHLAEARMFIASARRAGGKCVVHCVAGLNRAGVIAAAERMLHERMTVLAAVREGRRVRGNSFLWNKSFQEQLVILARLEGLLGVRPGEPGSVVLSATDGSLGEAEQELALKDEEERLVSVGKATGSAGGDAGLQGEGHQMQESAVETRRVGASEVEGGGERGEGKEELRVKVLAAGEAVASLRLRVTVQFGPCSRDVEYALEVGVSDGEEAKWSHRQWISVAADVAEVAVSVETSEAMVAGTYLLTAVVSDSSRLSGGGEPVRGTGTTQVTVRDGKVGGDEEGRVATGGKGRGDDRGRDGRGEAPAFGAGATGDDQMRGSGEAQELGAVGTCAGGSCPKRHPEDRPCGIGTSDLRALEPNKSNKVAVQLTGQVVGARYRLALEVWSTETGENIQTVGLRFTPSGESDSMQMEVPPLPHGTYTLVFTAFEDVPGLSEDDALLAVWRRPVDVQEPVHLRKRDHKCTERLVWPAEGDLGVDTSCASRQNNATSRSRCTLAMVSGVESTVHVASAFRRWNSDAVIAFYGRTEEEVAAADHWIRGVLGPASKQRCQRLRAFIVPPCKHPGNASRTWDFPASVLRSIAVKHAETDNVVIADAGWIPSDALAESLEAAFASAEVNVSEDVLVVPAFEQGASSDSRWPLGSTDEDSVGVAELRERLRHEKLQIAGMPLENGTSSSISMHLHGATDYMRWLNESVDKQCAAEQAATSANNPDAVVYEVEYTLGYTPLIAFNRSSAPAEITSSDQYWEKAFLSYLFAARGFGFQVLRQGFVVEAPPATAADCPGTWGDTCRFVGSRTAPEERGGWWRITQLPPVGSALPRELRTACILPTYGIMAALGAQWVTEAVQMALSKLHDGFTALYRQRRDNTACKSDANATASGPEVPAVRWQSWQRRACFGALPMFGRVLDLGRPGLRVVLDKRVLEGLDLGGGAAGNDGALTYVHWESANFHRLVMTEDHSVNVRGLHEHEVALVLDRRHQCREFHGATACKLNTLLYTDDGVQLVDADRLAVLAKEDAQLVQSSNATSDTASALWKTNRERWKEWYYPAYTRVLRSSLSARGHEIDFPTPKSNPSAPSFDFPVAVFNLPRRSDKRAHMERLMAALGFTNVEFPKPMDKNEVDVEKLVKTGDIVQEVVTRLQKSTTQGPGAVGPCVAHALTQSKWMREKALEGHDVIGLFEDDLLISVPFEEARHAIQAALQSLPETADLLYLEACHENCERVRYSPGTDAIGRLHGPFCSGAIIVTRKGMMKVLKQLYPVFDVVDNMYQAHILDFQLEAYISLPPPLFQDGFWSTDAGRISNLPNQKQDGDARKHVMVAPLCEQIQPLELTLVARLVQKPDLPAWAAQELQERGLAYAGGGEAVYAILDDDPAQASTLLNTQWSVPRDGIREYAVIEWFTMRYSRKAGEWRNQTASAGVLLVLDEQTECYHSLREKDPLCAVEVRMRAPEREWTVGAFYIVFDHLA